MKTLRTITAALLSVLIPTQSVIAQTPPQNSEIVIVPSGETLLRWFAKEGRTYFIQASDPNDHLRKWIWFEEIEHGHDHTISHEVGTTADKAFFRLHYTDTPPPAGVTLEQWDADGDSLPNALELDQQGNPLHPDTNGDGIPDGWSHAHGHLPTANIASGFFQGGTTTNLQAYQLGVQAHPNATLEDHDADGIANEDDADPQDIDVDWKPASVGGYALIEINVPSDAGYVRDFNDAGHVLFDQGVWKSGVWTALDDVEIEGDFHLDPYDFTYSSQGSLGWKLSPTGDILELGLFNVYGPGDTEDLNHVLRHGYEPQNSTYQAAVSSLDTLDWYGQSGYAFSSFEVLGEDSQGRVFTYKHDSPEPEIWTLDTGLAQTDYFQLPQGYHLYLHGNQVTPAGWLAVNAYPHTGNSPTARTIVWNPAGQEITTDGGLPYYFSGLTELPHGKPALACRYHGTNGLVYLLNQSGTAFKTAAKLSGKNIHTFAGDGTAMTSDHKMWINGKLIPIREICPQYAELVDDGWTFQIHKANKNGIYLIEAHKDDESRPYLYASLDVSWQAIPGSYNVDDHIDPWNQPIKGKRIFPDFKNPDDTEIRHKLHLIVKTSPVLAGRTVHVKAFDVDDSTSEEFDLNEEGTSPVIDTNGIPGAGDDNMQDYLNTPNNGQFWDEAASAWGGRTTTGIIDTNGETKFDFRVGMQPGSNYRVVASIDDDSMYEGVQVTDPNADKYLGPEHAQTGGASASSLLTVWRRLWVENDSMEAIPTDQWGYKRNDLSADTPNPIVNAATLNAAGTGTLFYISPISDGSSFLNLENGYIMVQSIVHQVTGAGMLIDDHVVSVGGDHTSVPAGSAFRLYDDDDFGLVEAPLPRNNLVDNLMKSFFRTSYLEVTDTMDFNTRKTVPFRKNDDLQTSSIFHPSNTVVNESKDLSEKSALWVSHLTAAYQPGFLEDGDPFDPNTEGPMYGGTRVFDDYAHSTVFVESCREDYDHNFRLSANGGNPIHAVNALANLEKYVTAQAAHEIGHQPGNDEIGHDDHAEQGLMREGGADPNHPEHLKFTPKTVLRFRTAKKWSQK